MSIIRKDQIKRRDTSPPLKRDQMMSVRLTSVEYKAIKGLAERLNVSPSQLVRHFLMQVVEHYREESIHE